MSNFISEFPSGPGKALLQWLGGTWWRVGTVKLVVWDLLVQAPSSIHKNHP